MPKEEIPNDKIQGTTLVGHVRRLFLSHFPTAVALLLAADFMLAIVRHQSIVHAASAAPAAAGAPAYTADGRLLFPARYREWIYLTTGMDMSYTPMAGMGGQSTFDNVFVNPDSYQAFVRTGTWPDKTTMLIEVRGAKSHASINKSGHFQSVGVDALEVHVRDDSRTPGGWAFYQFDGGDASASSKMVPKTADCYSCHEQHGAVATTFVQFYPTLLPIAKDKGTLSADFLTDEAAHQ